MKYLLLLVLLMGCTEVKVVRSKRLRIGKPDTTCVLTATDNMQVTLQKDKCNDFQPGDSVPSEWWKNP